MKIAYITLICLFTTSNSFSQIKNNRMENYKSNFYSYLLLSGKTFNIIKSLPEAW